MLRKNKNVDPKCSVLEGGVDLNRNYSFKWALDDKGSSSDPCDSSYRGSGPFSEPETQAMRNWMLGNKLSSENSGSTYTGYKGLKGGLNCVSAMNFHSYGDLWIEPYNYINDKTDKELERKNHILFEAY
jgi:carboxypeptidase T